MLFPYPLIVCFTQKAKVFSSNNSFKLKSFLYLIPFGC